MKKEKLEIAISKVCSLPKSIFWNFRLFSFKQAIKLPLLIHFRTKVYIDKGKIILPRKVQSFDISFGFGGSIGISRNKESFFILRNNAKLKIDGKCTFAAGFSIRIDGGILKIGNNFNMNKNCCINVFNKVTIGKNVLLGWNVTIIDNDGHTIDLNKNIGEITINDNCWLSAHSYILKNVNLGSENVVAAKSLVTSSITKKGIPSKSLIAGHPAKVIKTDITWRE